MVKSIFCPYFELDDNHTTSNMTDNEVQEHVHRMHGILELCLHTVEDSLQGMLPMKCAVLVELCTAMKQRFHQEHQEKPQSMQQYVVMLLFLRTINPCLANPQSATVYCAESLQQGEAEGADNMQHIQRVGRIDC